MMVKKGTVERRIGAKPFIFRLFDYESLSISPEK